MNQGFDDKSATGVVQLADPSYVPHLGNLLCEYYFSAARRWVDHSEASVDTRKLGWLGQYLPSEGISLLVTEEQRMALSVALGDSDFCRLGPGKRWRPERTSINTFVAFWSAMKEFVRDTLDDALKRSNLAKNIPCPVVHFRCSDVPFSRHPGYHLPKKSYYAWCLEEIGNVNEVVILAAHTHKVEKPESVALASRQYTDFIKDIFAGWGIRVHLQSESVAHDFSTLFYAPAVISTGSSFSYMAGYASGKFYSCQCVEEERVRHAALPWNYGKLPLLHREVRDYFDTRAVIEQLNDC